MTRDEILALRDEELIAYYDRCIEALTAYKAKLDHISELETVAIRSFGKNKAQAEARARAAKARLKAEIQGSQELLDALIFFEPDQVDAIKELRRIVRSGLVQGHADAIQELIREAEHREIVDVMKGSAIDRLLQAANAGATIISMAKG